MSWQPRVRTLLAGLFAVVLTLPILAGGVARFFDNQLVWHTEELLIAEAVVVGEAYRQLADPVHAAATLQWPADPRAERYFPFRPALDLRSSPLLAPAERIGSSTTAIPGAAAARMTALLERSVVRNLSGVRLLDAKGRVIASPLHEVGYSLAHLPEVQAALRGEYRPSLRARYSDEPPPPVTSLSRAAALRLSIAVPIYEDPQADAGRGGEIIGAVYNSRTPINVAEHLWHLRHALYLPVTHSLFVTAGIVLVLSAMIARPLSRLRRAAERVAAGRSGERLEIDGFAPQEVHALSRSLSLMRDQLEARAAYVKQFATNAAHELKTPLTSLRGAAELLLDGGDEMPKAQVQRFLTNIHEDAVRMDGLVQRILQLARIESSSPARERVDLRAFLEGMAERCERRGAEIRLRYESGSPWLEVDPEQLDALVSNLVDNAVRHGEGRPVDLTVRDASGGARELSVRDHGPPLPEGHLERAFERFYSTERNRGGTGLGLSIARAIAEAHGGSIRAERKERGADFIVVLR